MNVKIIEIEHEYSGGMTLKIEFDYRPSHHRVLLFYNDKANTEIVSSLYMYDMSMMLFNTTNLTDNQVIKLIKKCSMVFDNLNLKKAQIYSGETGLPI